MDKLYCTIFIVDISQNPEEVDTVTSRITQLIEDHGGVIQRVNPWGKRRLAYEIKKRTHGYYVEIEFTANSRLNIPRIIEEEYRLNDRVLRYLTYVVSKEELAQRRLNEKREKKAQEEAARRAEEARAQLAERSEAPAEASETAASTEAEGEKTTAPAEGQAVAEGGAEESAVTVDNNGTAEEEAPAVEQESSEDETTEGK
ncbi:MAG: 30S ribosomal protein S6 [Calditrichaeota bacterium]|nr:MAG: 30S ribosomal protein S6 [Calditrichota bacterium]